MSIRRRNVCNTSASQPRSGAVAMRIFVGSHSSGVNRTVAGTDFVSNGDERRDRHLTGSGPSDNLSPSPMENHHDNGPRPLGRSGGNPLVSLHYPLCAACLFAGRITRPGVKREVSSLPVERGSWKTFPTILWCPCGSGFSSTWAEREGKGDITNIGRLRGEAASRTST